MVDTDRFQIGFSEITYNAERENFTPIDGNSNIRWEEEQTLSFKFKLFCFVPYGTHAIHVIDFSKHSIYTNESNIHVPVWNHKILLNALPDGTTEYSDEVEIGAG